jgi:hypothetical protein
MNGRELITLLVGLMLGGVLVWTVTAWVYTSAMTLVSGVLIGLMVGGLLLWVIAWRLESREPRQRLQP